MTVSRTLLLGGILAASLLAQSQAPKEDGLPTINHCGDNADLPMTHTDRMCYWWTHSFNAGMLIGAGFNSALDPLINNATNADWGQGWEGFGRRFGTRVSQGLAKGTGQAIVGVIFKEDPRPYESHQQGFGKRLGFALAHTFIVRNDNGKERFSFGRVAGSFASGFVGMAWTPDRINTPQQALIRSGTAMSGSLTASLFKEFQPDLMKMLSGMFSKPPKTTPKKVDAK